MSEYAREYPRRDAALPPFADMAGAGAGSVLARLAACPAWEGRDIATRQAQEIIACADARREETGTSDSKLATVLAALGDASGSRLSPETTDLVHRVPDSSPLARIVDQALAGSEVSAAARTPPESPRALALRSVVENAENFDRVSVELRKDPGFRSEAMRANPLIARRWSYYEHADPREVERVFDQAERAPSLLAGMRPEIIVRFLTQRSEHVRPEHFSVLPDWHLSVTIQKLLRLQPAKTSFGAPDAPILLSDVVRDMRPQILFDIERGAWYAKSARDKAKLAESARYAAGLFRDPRVFAEAPLFPETIRDAVPSALWADPDYVQPLLEALGMEAFPPALLSGEVRASLGLPTAFEGTSIGELAWVRTLADLLSEPRLLASLQADPSLVRALPLATQRDGAFMAFIVERIPVVASGRFLSSEALAHPDVIRACYTALGAEAGTDGIPLDYERLTVRDMGSIAAAYGTRATLDLRFLERIESAMSQGGQDAPEWRALYERLYARERELMGEMRSILYRSQRTVRSDGGDFKELMLDEAAWSKFAGGELKDALSGLDAGTLEFISRHRDILHGLLSHLGSGDQDTGALYWYASTLGEQMKKDPALAGKLQVALVRINRAYHDKKVLEIADGGSRWLSKTLENSRKAEAYLERTDLSYTSQAKFTDPDIAKWLEIKTVDTPRKAKAPDTKPDVGANPAAARDAGHTVAEAPAPTKDREIWARLWSHFGSRTREHLRAHPASPGERPGAVLARALDAAFADAADLDQATVAGLRAVITEQYWHRRNQSTLASSVIAEAMAGRVTREEFARRAEMVADLATEHYALGLSAEESLAITASAEYASAVRSLAPQAPAAPAVTGASALGYPASADGTLAVDSAGRGAVYRLDPATGTISSPDGLSLSLRPDAQRADVERAVSSLDFLRACGLSFIGGDVGRVFELAHRLDPAASLRPEDGLDESERRLLLSALLPFFGVELPEGAIYSDMVAALDRLNHGTTDGESGLLLQLARQGAPYVDPDSLGFRFADFERAFGVWAQERFDSAPVSI